MTDDELKAIETLMTGELPSPYADSALHLVAEVRRLRAQLATARAEATEGAVLVAQRHALKWLDLANEKAGMLTPAMGPDHPWRKDVHQHRAMAAVAHDIAGELLAAKPAVMDLDWRLAPEDINDTSPPAKPKDHERVYPCDRCGKMRSKDEGGTVFTVCDACWDATTKPTPAATCATCGDGPPEIVNGRVERCPDCGSGTGGRR